MMKFTFLVIMLYLNPLNGLLYFKVGLHIMCTYMQYMSVHNILYCLMFTFAPSYHYSRELFFFCLPCVTEAILGIECKYSR